MDLELYILPFMIPKQILEKLLISANGNHNLIGKLENLDYSSIFINL